MERYFSPKSGEDKKKRSLPARGAETRGGYIPPIIWLYTLQQFEYGLLLHPLQLFDSGVHLSAGL